MNEAALRLTVGPIQNPVRGLLHGAGAVWWLLFAAGLASDPAPPGRSVALLCAASQATLFATSALYHSLPWRPRWKRRMQRADHAMIHVKIAGTITALSWLALPAAFAVAAAAGAWAVAAAGVAHKAWCAELCERPSIRLQLGHSLLGLPAGVALALEAPPAHVALLVGGALAYVAGALCFVTRRPTLWPRVFSFHEVFHLLTLAGSGAHFALLARALAR
jgi:hemolysin III